MRVCPKCKKRELDVTDKLNNYKCWNCGYFCIGVKHLKEEDEKVVSLCLSDLKKYRG